MTQIGIHYLFNLTNRPPTRGRETANFLRHSYRITFLNERFLFFSRYLARIIFFSSLVYARIWPFSSSIEISGSPSSKSCSSFPDFSPLVLLELEVSSSSPAWLDSSFSLLAFASASSFSPSSSSSLVFFSGSSAFSGFGGSRGRAPNIKFFCSVLAVEKSKRVPFSPETALLKEYVFPMPPLISGFMRASVLSKDPADFPSRADSSKSANPSSVPTNDEMRRNFGNLSRDTFGRLLVSSCPSYSTLKKRLNSCGCNTCCCGGLGGILLFGSLIDRRSCFLGLGPISSNQSVP
mmetsp:Transcript_20985/g.39377  ORF Transcript_20985/g.39377 Transcript_20985/m.39377 type:complete len:293 (-) Transcript_20985:229-1107(-)